MSAHFERGQLLFEQQRYVLAEGEFRLAAAAAPDAPAPHAMLALALLAQERREEATTEAREAIGLAPDWGFAHYVHAKALADRNYMSEARAAIDEAIALDPTDPSSLAFRGALQFDLAKFADALASAELALAQDPEHTSANNVRAMALVKLGRRAEAGATIDATLARDPENADTHANQGWALLEGGDRAGALDHFREALRLDPDNEWARQGIVETLKSKHRLYSFMLRYFFWMSRLEPRTQWMVIVGGFLGNRMLSAVSGSNPALAPVVLPLQILYVVFVFLTWTADPLSNLLLRLDRFGRLVLSPEQVRASNWVGATLLGALGAGTVALVTRNSAWGVFAFGCAFMLIPIAAVFRTPVGWPRHTMVGYAIAMALAGLSGSIATYVVMLVGVGWVANFLIQQRPKR